MNEMINRLKSIDKTSLSEREFYTEVLKVLDTVEPSEVLDSKSRKEIRAVLEDIGCINAETWRREKTKNGEPIDEYFNAYLGVRNASIFEAINMVSQFYRDDNHSYVLEIMKLGTPNSMAKEWLERNQIIYGPAPEFDELIQSIKGIKKDNVKERTFYEEVLKKITTLSHYEDFTPEMYGKVIDALKEIGCVSLDKWQEERKKQGKDFSVSSYKESGIGFVTADIATAVEITSDFMKSYEDSKDVLDKVCGDRLYTMDWIGNSEEMRQSNLQMYITMQELSRIDKTALSERKFYENVLRVVANNPTTMLSRESHDELKDILNNIGVEDYETWSNKEELSSERIVDNYYKKRNGGRYDGMLDTAVIHVGQLLGDYSSARMGFDYLRGEGRLEINTWINDSKSVAAKQSTMASIITKMGIRQRLERMDNDRKRKDNELKNNGRESIEEII